MAVTVLSYAESALQVGSPPVLNVGGWKLTVGQLP